MLEGHVPIWRHIIASSYILLDKLHEQVCGPDTIVLGYNTDAIKVSNPRNDFTPVEKSAAVPGDIIREPVARLRGPQNCC